MAKELEKYARRIADAFGRKITGGEIFAKILTSNDDSGRHGVLVPGDVYSFFPDFVIPDTTKNETLMFDGFDALAGKQVGLSYKYYERYPERRITRLNGVINERAKGKRLIVFLKLHLEGASAGYYVDAALESDPEKFQSFVEMFFGRDVPLDPGTFVRKEITASRFTIDASLAGLLEKFDDVKGMGWVDALRSGDTGVGYTFETLIGVAENNSREADYKGIEIKCKQLKDSGAGGGKINLFQQTPKWTLSLSGIERLKLLGRQGLDGHYACHSQVTTQSNNIDLKLALLDLEQRIDLLRGEDEIGYWLFDVLQKRLEEKHSRAVFVKAKVRRKGDGAQFSYEELVYCEHPSIQRFVELVRSRDIVFEFLMSEKDGRVRNHGYPWRLGRSELLDSLFSLQIKLRG